MERLQVSSRHPTATWLEVSHLYLHTHGPALAPQPLPTGPCTRHAVASSRAAFGVVYWQTSAPVPSHLVPPKLQPRVGRWARWPFLGMLSEARCAFPSHAASLACSVSSARRNCTSLSCYLSHRREAGERPTTCAAAYRTAAGTGDMLDGSEASGRARVIQSAGLTD